MGWEGAWRKALLCAHTTLSTRISWKAPVAPKTILFLEAGKLESPISLPLTSTWEHFLEGSQEQ